MQIERLTLQQITTSTWNDGSVYKDYLRNSRADNFSWIPSAFNLSDKFDHKTCFFKL